MAATTTDSELSATDQQKNFEDQFADLMGGVGDGSAVLQNGDVTTTTTTTTDGDGVTMTTTTTTTTTEGHGDGTQIQEPDPGTEANKSRGAPTQFEDTLADYQPPKRPAKKDDGKDNKGPNVFITPTNEAPTSEKKIPKSLRFLGGGADNMCKKCNKRVYEMEKIIADKSIFHKSCFRCAHCKRVLTLGNFAGIDDQTYCKPHFIELFKKKGKYDMAKQTQERRDDPPPRQEVKDVQQPSAAPSERLNGSSSDSHVAIEEAKEEPVRYQQMHSVRNMFETAAQSPAQNTTPTQRKPSKWDKPSAPAPAPIQSDPERHTTSQQHDMDSQPIRDQEDTGAEEGPPTAITRNLVARFRELEGDQGSAPPDRKPVHKITPPRDELARGIEEARLHHDYDDEREASPEPQRDDDIIKSGGDTNTEAELPAAQHTRTMLAKFKSLEDVNQQGQAPPSPQQVKSVSVTTVRTTTTANSHRSRASPDSGIVDVDHSGINGEQSRAMDYQDSAGHDEEETKELPEQGFTKNLLAKWRCIEETSPDKSAVPLPTRKAATDSRQMTVTRQTVTHTVVSSGGTEERRTYREDVVDQVDGGSDCRDDDDMETHDHDRDIVKETDTNEEDYLPPPSFTKNMLAKFQTMESEAARNAGKELPTKKSFKWSVKEAPLISGSGMVWQEKRRGSSKDGDLDDFRHDDDHINGDGEINGRYHDNDGDIREEEYRDNADNSVFDGRRGVSGDYGAHQYNHHDESESYDNRRDSVSDSEDGIVRENDTTWENRQEELPPQALTRNLLERFRSIEDVNQPPPSPLRAERQQKVAYTSALGTGTRQFSSSTSSLNQTATGDGQGADNVQTTVTHVYSDDSDGELNNEAVFSDPRLRDQDLDGAEQEQLPEEGTTRNLLAKFSSLQAAAH